VPAVADPSADRGVSALIAEHELNVSGFIHADPFEDDTETFQLVLSNQSGNATVSRGTATGTIIPAFAVRACRSRTYRSPREISAQHHQLCLHR